MLPDKLLLERSNCSRPLNDSKVEGMIPWKRFPLLEKIHNLTQLPRLVGTLPNALFSEIFKNSRFFKFLTSFGKIPVNWLEDKSRKIGENERPMTSGGIEPLRLLLLRYNYIKFQQFLRLKGMLP